MPFTTVARCADVPEGRGLEVMVGDRVIALFHIDGAYYALDGLCPHRAGPLGQGDIDGKTVWCPWHAWRFDVRTGVNPDMPAARVKTFPTRVEGDELQIEIEPTSTQS